MNQHGPGHRADGQQRRSTPSLLQGGVIYKNKRRPRSYISPADGPRFDGSTNGVTRSACSNSERRLRSHATGSPRAPVGQERARSAISSACRSRTPGYPRATNTNASRVRFGNLPVDFRRSNGVAGVSPSCGVGEAGVVALMPRSRAYWLPSWVRDVLMQRNPIRSRSRQRARTVRLEQPERCSSKPHRTTSSELFRSLARRSNVCQISMALAATFGNRERISSSSRRSTGYHPAPYPVGSIGLRLPPAVYCGGEPFRHYVDNAQAASVINFACRAEAFISP